MSFDQWLIEVDELLVTNTGLAHDDLDDYLWFDDYEDGLAPLESVQDWASRNYPGISAQLN